MWAILRSGRRVKLIGCFVVVIALGIAALLARDLVSHRIWSEYTRWRAGGKAVSIETEHFHVLVFPGSEEARRRVGRAVLLSLDEWKEKQIGVMLDGQSENMDAAEFRILPEESEEGPEVDRLNQEIRRWGGETDWRRVEYSLNRMGYDGEAVAKLLIHTKRGDALEYVYRVTPEGRAIPVWELMYGRAPSK